MEQGYRRPYDLLFLDETGIHVWVTISSSTIISLRKTVILSTILFKENSCSGSNQEQHTFFFRVSFSLYTLVDDRMTHCGQIMRIKCRGSRCEDSLLLGL